MHYLIDGYNLLFSLDDLTEGFSTKRSNIIYELNRKTKRLKIQTTVIFDAQYTDEDSKKTHYNSLEILFSGSGETADDLILKVLKQNSNNANFTVVTNDNRLAWKARNLGAKTEKVGAFMNQLNTKYAKALNKTTKLPSLIYPKDERAEKEPPKHHISETNPELFDYYLELFDKKLEPKQKKIDKKLTETERWLKIFEERLRNGEE